MSITKSRGKTALGPPQPNQHYELLNKTAKVIGGDLSTANNGATTTLQQQQQQPTYLPQTNLLKIEPFVPSLNTTRLRRRPIGRSYSTLSSSSLSTATTTTASKNSTYLKRSNNNALGPVAGATTLAQLRRHPVKVITRQRSKSTSSSASASAKRATNAAANANQSSAAAASTPSTTINGGVIITAQTNGICRMTRLAKEQEKLPDRINYDRRGLTAIPIFENEPNLRLLSLQHNLINIFHIPKEPPNAAELEQVTQPAALGDAVQQATEYNNNINSHNTVLYNGGRLIRQSTVISNHSMMSTRLPLNMSTPNVNLLNSNLIAHSLTPSPPPIPAQPPSSPLLSTQRQISLGCNGFITQLQLNRISLLAQKSNNNLLINTPLPQAAPSYGHFGLKRSKSFVTNYSRHMHHQHLHHQQQQQHNIKRNPQKSFLTKTEATMLATLNANTAAAAVAANLKSFDSTLLRHTTDSPTNSLPLFGNGIGGGEKQKQQEEQQQEMEELLEIKNKQLQLPYGMIFENLVFLDLYDNQIERIANLDGLSSLTVLLLGKNRITDISGLYSLRATLKVLDLHGNKITSVSNKINCLQELKSLNLAGNQIRQINQNDFNGLYNLKELNLKRNKIKRINGFQHLTALERLWLCHNDLHRVEDMSSIAKALNLLEVTMENNPVSLAGDCVSFLVSYLPRLQTLSQMPITEQVRCAAMAWRKNKELSDANYSMHQSTEAFNNIRREEVISNARTNWELLRSQQTMQAVTLQSGGKRNNTAAKQTELAKINESSNETVLSYEEELQEFIKLPPIQPEQKQLQLEQQVAEQKQKAANGRHNSSTRASDSSVSSLGPNVDSSSSCFSSDNEESSKSIEEVEQQQLAQRINKSQAQANEGRRVTIADGRNNSAAKQLPSNGNDNETSITKAPQPAAVVAIAQDKIARNNNSTASEGGEEGVNYANQASNNSSMHANNTTTRITTLLTKPTLERPTSNTRSINGMILRTTNAGVLASSSRAPTASTATITASSNALSLGGLQVNSNLHATTAAITMQQTNGTITTATATTTITKTTTTNTNGICKRYMQGSLMRSQTVAAVSSNTNGNNVGASGVKANFNAIKTNTGLQNQHHNNLANNSATSNSNNNKTNVASSVTPVMMPLAMATSAAAPNNKANNNNNNNTMTVAVTKSVPNDREREQGGDYLIEICGRYLNIYGQGALRFIDKQWNPAKANDVHTLNFSYINFNNITTLLPRIKVRFPHAENFVFRETNICCLGQLNALAELQGITSLCIDPEGNAITTKDLWRQYAIYRLSHWGLKMLNGMEISEAEVEQANVVYEGLSDLVLWSMPEVMLQPLLARLRLDETCSASKLSPKEWLMKPDNKSLQQVVGKEALQWKKSSANVTSTVSNNNNNSNNYSQLQQYYAYDVAFSMIGGNVGPTTSSSATSSLTFSSLALAASSSANSTSASVAAAASNAAALSSSSSSAVASLSMRERGKIHFALMMENTCNAVEKLHKLEILWPSLLLDIVRNTLLDYSQLDVYLRNLMNDIMK